MDIKKKALVIFALLLWVVPEILYSPSLQIFYSLLTRGKVLRDNAFQHIGNTFIFFVILVQLVGTISLIKLFKSNKPVYIFFWIITVLIAVALLLVYSFSNVSL